MTRRAGPYSRLDLPTFNGRTKEGAFLRGVRAELVNHVGGKPSPTQAALIEAAAQLRLRISMMDRKFGETREQSDHDSRTYLAWVGALGRLMTRLDGLKGAAATRPPTLAELFAAPRASKAAPDPIDDDDDTDAPGDDAGALAGFSEAAE
jgi:hypothetical protein